MRNFDNRQNKDRNFDNFNNQNHDSYGGYNNYYNNSDYYNSNSNNYNGDSNYYNNSNSSNSVFENISDNRIYDYGYNKSSKRIEEFYKHKKKENRKNILLFFTILIILVSFGAYLIIGYYLQSTGVPSETMRNYEKIFPGFTCLIGLGLMVIPPINKYIKKKHCRHLLKATVVDLKSGYDNEGHRVYKPVYDFYYKGQIYHVEDSSARNFSLPTVGSQIDMLINEDDPYEFYVEFKMGDFFYMVGGLMFFVTSLLFLISGFKPMGI